MEYVEHIPLNVQDIKAATRDDLLCVPFLKALSEQMNNADLLDAIALRCNELGIYQTFNKKYETVLMALANSEVNNTDLFQSVFFELQRIAPENDPKYSRNNDKAMAQLFADIYKNKARYNIDAKEWYYYDGITWSKDLGAMHVKQYMKILADALYQYAFNKGDESYRTFVNKLQNFGKRQTIIEDAKDINFISMSMLDTQKNLFNCLNCIIDLDSGNIMEHDASLLLSKVANVNYERSAHSDLFDKFLKEVFFDDQEKIEYLQKVFGYCLTGYQRREEYYMCFGATTRNGKSTLVDTITDMFGDYARTTAPETFALKKRNTQSASPDIAALKGVRLIHIGETPKGMVLDVALMKRFTGNDKIEARGIFESPINFRSSAKIIMNTNYLPIVSDDSLFTSGRVKVVEFNRHFAPHEQDIHLKEKLSTAENLSAILNWCLDGLAKYKEDHEKLIPPKSVQDTTKEYQCRSDRVASFIKDALIETDKQDVWLHDVYSEYTKWCKQSGYVGIENMQTFKDKIKQKGMYAENGTIIGANGKKVSKYNVIKNYKFNTSNGFGPYGYL